MDPNLFHLDWAKAAEVLAALVVLSFLLERALAVLFESRYFLDKLGGKSFKEIIAFTFGAVMCWYWKFDAVSIILTAEKTGIFGYIITGGMIAGGSKAAVKLFRDVMGFKSEAIKEREALGKTPRRKTVVSEERVTVQEGPA